jgi:glycosyltransferase involved in cell wall biosynthesis
VKKVNNYTPLSAPVSVTEQVWTDDIMPVVSVFNWVYNHKEYIRESIESILMQQTTFPIEIIIHDDASNDGTKEIILEYQEKYPRLFRNILQEENQWSQGKSVMAPLITAPRGNYIALTHGDDYWTDPLKLQKQVDFLEENPTYTICWTDYNELGNNILSNPDWNSHLSNLNFFEVNLKNFSYPYCTLTLTTLFRASCITSLPINKMRHFKDNTLYIACLSEGKGALLKFKSAIYRIHDTSIYSSSSSLTKAISNFFNITEIIFFFPLARNKHFKFLFHHFQQTIKSQINTTVYFHLLLQILKITVNAKAPKALIFLLSKK